MTQTQPDPLADLSPVELLRVRIREARAKIAPRKSQPVENIVEAATAVVVELQEAKEGMETALADLHHTEQDKGIAEENLTELLELVGDAARGVKTWREVIEAAHDMDGDVVPPFSPELKAA